MTDMPTSTEIRASIEAWQKDARDDGRSLAAMLKRVADAQDSVLERGQRVAEEYSTDGIPRRAAERAKAHGVRVHIGRDLQSRQVIIATFPNGGVIQAMTRSSARRALEAGNRSAFMGRIVGISSGAAPGTRPQALLGEHLADVLNRFADSKEA